MNIPIKSVRAAITVIVAVASIALIAACSTEEPTPAARDLPKLGQFISSEDCANLEHGHLETIKLTLTGVHTSTDPAVAGNNPQVAILVESAALPSERAQGLMCRESIPEGTGMIFTYVDDRASAFWMHNTYSPIDILYIDKSGLVVDRIRMSPCLREGLSDDDWQVKCATESVEYVPRSSYRYALELPAGWLAERELHDPESFDLQVSWSPLESSG